MKDLTGRVALVTGASRGIGAQIATRLAAEKMKLALVARSSSALEEVASRLRQEGAEVLAVTADVTEPTALEAMLAKVYDHFGGVDVLINNAGIENYGHFTDSSPEELRYQVQLNLTAPLVLSRMVLPQMLKAGRGHIVNMASTAALGGVPYGVSYAATKAAMITFTFSLRMEYAQRGVSASVIVPGFVEGAGMYENIMSDLDGARSPMQLGSTTSVRVAHAVVKAIRADKPEVICNSMPFRPFLGLGRTFPRMGSAVVRMLAGKYMKAIADARHKEQQTP